MGFSLRPLGRKLWETITPVDEGAQRRATENLNRANQQLQSQPAKFGVLRNQQAREQFVKQNQPTNLNVRKATVQSVLESPKNTAKAFQYGTPRSLAGTVEGFSGLYDLATPGTGTNRFTKLATRAGRNLDEAAVRAGVDPATYKLAQLTTDAAGFLAPSATFSALGKGGKVGKALSSAEPLINKTGLKYISKPATWINAGVGTARSSGFRTARGGDTSPTSVATDVATNLAFGKVLDTVGNKVAGPIANKVKQFQPDAPKAKLKAQLDTQRSILGDMKAAEMRAKGADRQALAKNTMAQQQKVKDIQQQYKGLKQDGSAQIGGPLIPVPKRLLSKGDQPDNDVTARLWKDYVESKPTVKGSALSGEGAQLPPKAGTTVASVDPVTKKITVKPKANDTPFKSETEISQINRILKNEDTVAGGEKIGDYYRRAKGEDWRVVEMTPDEYLNRAAKAMGSNDPQFWRGAHTGDVKKYAADMKKGDKFPMPWINEVAGSQEGRTRALAAKEAGQNRIKVAVAEKYNPEAYKARTNLEADLEHNNKMLAILKGESTKPKVGFKKMDQAGGGAVGDSEVLAAIRKLQGREQPKLPNGTGLEDVKVKSGLGTQLETAFVEKDQPIIGVLRQIEKKSGKKGLVDQFMYDSGLVSRSDSIANAKLSSNPNLKGALEGLSKKKLGEFNDYSSARSELYNATRGLPTTRPVEELQAIVNQLGGENAARFDSLNRFYKDYAKDLYDGGIISREKFDQFVSSPDYVRTQRDMADLIGFKSGSGGGYSLKSTLTSQKRVGSSKREILPADRTAFDYAQKTQAEIQRNQAATNLIDMLQGTDLIRKIKEGEKVGNKNTVARFVDGVQEQFEVTPEIKQAVDHLAPYQLGLLQKIVSAPKRIFQAGTTGLSAPFTVANYVKDQLGSGINSKNIIATHNPINIFRGLKEASQDFFGARNSDAWERFLAHSGDTTQFDLLRGEKNAAQLSRELRMGGVGKTINRVLSPIKTLEDAVSITEKATRYQNFLGMEKTALKEGATKPQALKAGTLAAWQNSTDFNRYGDWSKTLNLLIPYFNSGVQGTRQLTRSFKTRPVATTIKTMATVGMPLLASTAYNLSDPDRKKIYDNISEFEKENNFILIPPGSKQNKDGTYDVYKLPMPFGYSNLMGPARRAMVSFANKSPQDWAKVATDIMGAFSGPVNTNSPQQAVAGLIPQAVKPLVQQAANKDFFTGKDIVPEYVNKATDAQGNPIPESKKALSYTSGSAQIIGNLSGQSPIRVEKFFKDTFGRIGQYGTNTADNVLAKLGVIDEKQIGGVSAKDDIIRRFTKAQGNYNYEKSAGGKYYDNVKEATKGLDANEQAAYSTLHPSKTNFLGEDIFDENKRLTKYARAGIYLQFPDVFEADRRLNEAQAKQGAPSNPLYELPPAQLTRVLLKATLPPGSKDPELSNLYQQEWYQDYNTKRSQYYEQIKSKMAKEGKSLPPSDNPYPETPKALQKTMDTYSSLPKGTGARSAWIKANPQAFEAMKNQWSAVDAWENKERVALGLSPIENTDTSKQYGNSGYGSGGGRTATSYAGKSKVSVKGTVAKPKISTKSPGKLQGSVKYAASSKPKVSIRKSLV